jgi:predicted PurR-regulated permease PerM
VATAAALLGLFLVGIVLIAAMTPLVVRQVQELIADVPEWLNRLNAYTQRFLNIDVSTRRIATELRNLDASVGSYAQNLAGNLLGFGAAVLEAVFQMFAIGLFTFYLVADGPRFRRAVCSLLRPERQRDVLWAWDVAIRKTGGYLYSRALLATVSGVATFVVLSFTGVPFAAPLALWMGIVSQFVPVVGTYLAMLVPLFVAFLDRPLGGFVLIAFFLLYQQIENYILGPRITARTMQLHPAVAFAAVLAGGNLMGAVGAFLALPAAAILQAGFSTYVRRHEVMDSELTREEEAVDAPEPRRRWSFGRRSQSRAP